IIPSSMPDATSLRCSLQFSGKSAIESVPEGKQEHLLGKFHGREFLGDGPDYFFILFRFNAAGAVNQNAFSFQQWNCCAQDPELPFLHLQEIVWGQTPAKIHPPAHYTCVATGCIHQDSVK